MNFYIKIYLFSTIITNILADQEYQLVLFLILGLLKYTSTPKKVNNLLLFEISILTINFDKQHKQNYLLQKKRFYSIFHKNI